MQLTIIFPSGNAVTSTTVEKISLPGRMGRFMVLRSHAPLVSSLESGDIIYTDAEGEHSVAISSGFCRVANDVTEVAAEPSIQIDEE